MSVRGAVVAAGERLGGEPLRACGGRARLLGARGLGQRGARRMGRPGRGKGARQLRSGWASVAAAQDDGWGRALGFRALGWLLRAGGLQGRAGWAAGAGPGCMAAGPRGLLGYAR